MDYDTLKTRTNSYLRRTGTIVETTLIPEFLQEAQDELCRKYMFRFQRHKLTVALVATQSIYTLVAATARFVKLKQLRFENAAANEKRPWLQKGSIMELKGAYANAPDAQQPLYWDYAMQEVALTPTSQVLEQIELFPTPDVTAATGQLNVYAYVYIPYLVNAGDTNPFTDWMPYALIYSAAAKAKFYLEQTDKALEYMAMADRLVDSIVVEDRVKQLDDPFYFEGAHFDMPGGLETYGDASMAYSWT